MPGPQEAQLGAGWEQSASGLVLPEAAYESQAVPQDANAYATAGERLSRADIMEVVRNAHNLMGKTVVFKFGGETIDKNLDEIADDLITISSLGAFVVAVHGGSPHIARAFADAEVETKKVDGKRITPEEHVPIVAGALAEANWEMVNAVNTRKADLAVGFTEGVLIGNLTNPNDFGSVDSESVKISFNQDESPSNQTFDDIKATGRIAIVSCNGRLEANQALTMVKNGQIQHPELGVPGININADIAGSSIAIILGAHKFVSIVDVGAVLDKKGRRIKQIHGRKHAQSLMRDGTVGGGMKPKLEETVRAVESGRVGSGAISGAGNAPIELFTDDGAATIVFAQ